MLLLGFFSVFALALFKVFVSARTPEQDVHPDALATHMALLDPTPSLALEAASPATPKVQTNGVSSGDAKWRRAWARSRWGAPPSAVEPVGTNQVVHGERLRTNRFKPFVPLARVESPPPALQTTMQPPEDSTNAVSAVAPLKLGSADDASGELPYDTIVWGYQGQPIGAVGGGPPFKGKGGLIPISAVPEPLSYLTAIGALAMLGVFFLRKEDEAEPEAEAE